MTSLKTPPPIILASQSPRRIQLLKEIGLEFTVEPSNFDELSDHHSPQELATLNSQGKARDIAQQKPGALIIAADTIGYVNGQILGKPRDRQHAFELIKSISGTTHQVLTAVTIIDSLQAAKTKSSSRELSHITTTEVNMEALTDQQIEQYLDTNEWTDKAAAYAIQGHGAIYISGIKGDYFNVVGLPLNTLRHMFLELGYQL